MEIFLTMGINSNLLYIDPAATSILLTSITAIVAAVGAGILIAWRAVKKKVNKALHIDENANKEVEDELVLSDDLKDGATGEESDAPDAENKPDEQDKADENSNSEATVDAAETEKTNEN